MNNVKPLIRKFYCLTSTFLLVIGSSSLSYADDTEIFIGSLPSATPPNVLLVLDTSGSMGGEVNLTPPYDSTATYAGPCDESYHYWNGADEPPNCETTDQKFLVDVYTCDAAQTRLTDFGSYRDRHARWRTSDDKWRNLSGGVSTQQVECKADYGRHGDGSSSIHVYPRNGNKGPWHSGPRRSIKWNDYNRRSVFTGHFLNYLAVSVTEDQSKISILRQVSTELIGNLEDINLGLMRFSRNGLGGHVIHEIADVEENRDSLLLAVNQLTDAGNTPISETMYEAQQYLAGRAVDFGVNSTALVCEPGDFDVCETLSQPSVDGSRDASGNYISPINGECQKTFIVLLSDGEPVGDIDANSRIKSLPGFSSATGKTSCGNSTDSFENCGDEIAAYLANRDLSPSLDDTQSASTFTIGFDIDHPLLAAMAEEGNGEYFIANDYNELREAFFDIFDEIYDRDVTFVAPAVSINSFNRLTHRDELYFSVYKPSPTPHWLGNLKRYRIGVYDGEFTIMDATDNPAVNVATNTFYDDAKSYWTLGDPDGYEVAEGGFSSRLNAVRNVYTVTDTDRTDVPLNNAVNFLHEDNAELTAALLGVADGERESLIRWARGLNADGSVRRDLGDSLHATPVIVSYGGTEEDPDLGLFYTTNDGFFHAVNPMAEAGDALELFSFVPPELISNLNVLKQNTPGSPPKAYGLDGRMTSFIKNDDGNKQVDAGENLYLFFGMRRGGKNLYAMDVTDRSQPELKWVIEGGSGDFAELGQTWSKMVPGTIRVDDDERDVLFVAGGYDTNQDTVGAPSEDSEGRAIFVIDVETGQRLWWAGPSGYPAGAKPDLELADMTNSIPGDLRVVDINNDGFEDRIYIGDTAGQLWRFDIMNYANATGLPDFSGGVIADLGGDDAANNRRFYSTPSVSLVTDPYAGSYLVLAIGSGQRSNPLGTEGSFIEDRFYTVRDRNVIAPAVDGDGDPIYNSVTEANLVDVTLDLNATVPPTSAGWMIRLRENEKVISPAMTADGRIFFTSFSYDSSTVISCNPSGGVGNGWSYVVDVANGAPSQLDGNEPGEDGYVPPAGTDESCGYRCEPTLASLPPEPVLVFLPTSEEREDVCAGLAEAAIMIGTEVKVPQICISPVKTYWFDRKDLGQ